jgi:hypothetical protein
MGSEKPFWEKPLILIMTFLQFLLTQSKCISARRWTYIDRCPVLRYSPRLRSTDKRNIIGLLSVCERFLSRQKFMCVGPLRTQGPTRFRVLLRHNTRILFHL